MKLAILVLLFLNFSSFAFAQESQYIRSLKGLSLYELRAHDDVKLSGDKIWFSGKQLSVLDTCVLGDKIRTLNKIEISEYDGDRFVSKGRAYLFKNIQYKKPVVDGDQTSEVTATESTQRMIKIVTNDSDLQDKYLFSKSFTIPNCH